MRRKEDNAGDNESTTAIDSVYQILDEMEELLVKLRQRATDLAEQGAKNNGE